ncbi:MAG: Cold shock protein CspA [Rhodospirillaceae bacterium]|jgi:CspA family cold shock protein|nr:cold-shock protein [Alphaproteobacteria bacterium]CAI8380885.1 MAG: Cold shock protein CspA [Rhodospirillaceae bacterium]
MATGTVKWFNTTKGYGFIAPEDGATDVFVHISAVQNSGMTDLQEGQQVEYELEAGKNGKTAAVNLKAV